MATDFRTQETEAPQWWREMRDLEHRVLLTTLVVVIVSFALYGFAQSIKLVDDFAANVITEAVSVAVTVTIIDRLNRQESTAQRKEELILQMGSTDNGIALEAVRLLRHYGWLMDGSLTGANFYLANLRGATLVEANLENARLFQADLQAVHLERANLQGAYLVGSKLQWANLVGANLRGADMRARFDEDTILPDSTYWSHDVDMTRFTDPNHPDFWEPEWVRQARERDNAE